MSNQSPVIADLQTALGMELTATHQYLLHVHVLEDWGLDLLADKMREEVQEELGHASKFIERILFLGGTPVLEPAATPVKADTLKALFEHDKTDEAEAIRFYTRAARTAQENDDIGSRRLFEEIVMDEEGHFSWLDLQLNLLERMGEPAFIAKNMSGPEAGE